MAPTVGEGFKQIFGESLFPPPSPPCWIQTIYCLHKCKIKFFCPKYFFVKPSLSPRLDLPNMAAVTATAFHQNNWSDQSEVHIPRSLYYNITEPSELAS